MLGFSDGLRFHHNEPASEDAAGHSNLIRLPWQRSKYIVLGRESYSKCHCKVQPLAVARESKQVRNYGYIDASRWRHFSSVNSPWFSYVRDRSGDVDSASEFWNRNRGIVKVGSCCWRRSIAHAVVSCDKLQELSSYPMEQRNALLGSFNISNMNKIIIL